MINGNAEQEILAEIREAIFVQLRRFKVGLNEAIMPQSICMPVYSIEKFPKETIDTVIELLFRDGYIENRDKGTYLTQKGLDAIS